MCIKIYIFCFKQKKHAHKNAKETKENKKTKKQKQNKKTKKKDRENVVVVVNSIFGKFNGIR